MPAPPTRRALVHPLTVRLAHWVTALGTVVMIGSGWRIYNNDPIFGWIEFPLWATLGGDPEITYLRNGDAGFGNALLWHFMGMWLVVGGLLVTLVYGLATGRYRRKLWPISPRGALMDLRDALAFKLSHADVSVSNQVQRLLYVGALLLLVLVVATGLAIWKPVQFGGLAALFGDFQGGRLWHFLAMAGIVGFLVVHVSLALLVPATMRAMITGRATIPAASPGDGRPAPEGPVPRGVAAAEGAR